MSKDPPTEVVSWRLNYYICKEQEQPSVGDPRDLPHFRFTLDTQEANDKKGDDKERQHKR